MNEYNDKNSFETSFIVIKFGNILIEMFFYLRPLKKY